MRVLLSSTKSFTNLILKNIPKILKMWKYYQLNWPFSCVSLSSFISQKQVGSEKRIKPFTHEEIRMLNAFHLKKVSFVYDSFGQSFGYFSCA